MELVLLRRLVTELQPVLVGGRTGRVYAAPRYDVVVASSSGRQHLWISVDPDDPHVCVRAARPKSERRPPAFAMAARKWGRGQRIANLDLVNEDRVLRLDWHGEPCRRRASPGRADASSALGHVLLRTCTPRVSGCASMRSRARVTVR